ncbi:iron sulfur assembly protein 1 [Metarhizium album ARSEF 1941]|uniref:Iron-sulfur assembly protein 1 n=1 Tax=Metarhizium album (strain ARSEF 1941) TaxID=1081103 RepID=A0A0B2X0B0_METAS|nr:iron sulfur assembly protein 1 [Metarhizium album ARSEF 1941]KHN99239.1 iron sulfur assembly protein 1 [Metarhizium album ARSEF 1941]
MAAPKALPRVHETRPPPRQAAPTAPPAATQDSQEPAKEPTSKSSGPAAQKPRATRPRPRLRPLKAAMKLTPAAVEQLRSMLDQPEPKLIKVGVRNRGCSGLAYHLEYVDKPGAFDELVEQDGVRVLIDSKALFSIIGTEMDWAEDKLNQRFVFKNPNIKEQCGCGESFMVPRSPLAQCPMAVCGKGKQDDGSAASGAKTRRKVTAPSANAAAGMRLQLSRIALSSRTDFEKRVWTALCHIPEGRVTTYGLLSKHLGSSPRAVGNALRRNPFAPEVPCHRVVATGMTLGGFKGRWPRDGEGITLDEKRSLLRREGIEFDDKGKVLSTPWTGWL